ncbi:hypothetical protein ACFQQB_63465 [Nonomuraea rubra]|uniref:hypothetical protein n=1 Tax=Nonomuraea rubra TaxID=46180 RepID=UPI003617C931
MARLEESVRLFDKVGDEYGVIDASCNLGLVQLRWGDPNAAEQIFLTALDRARKIADVRGEAWTLEILGECAMILGRRTAGVRYLQDATELFAAAGERRGEAFALSNEALLIIDDLGWLPLPALARDALPPAAEQDAHHASALLDRAEKIFDVLGDARNSALVAVARIRIKILSGRDREAAKDARRTESMEGFDLDWRLRGLLLHCEAVLAHRSGSVRSALAKCEEALSLVQPFGDRPATASMTLHAGLLRKTMGEQDAETRVRKAQGIFREIGRTDGAQLCDRILAG